MTPAFLLVHLPSFLLLIGYPAYWIELYCFEHPSGHSSWLATGLFFVLILFFVIKLSGAGWDGFRVRMRHLMPPVDDAFDNFLWAVGLAFIVLIVGVSVMASSLPPHLQQEYDAINYHITVPRQHLLTGSFAHIHWAVADLFLLPVDYALAPYWLVTELPNKWPQFLFFLMLPLMLVSLAQKFGADPKKAWLVVFLILGAHGFSIQAGTAMLDVALCYLFVAALDSFIAGNIFLAAVECCFFVFSKPGYPVLSVALVLAMIIFWQIMRAGGWVKTWSWGFSSNLKAVPRESYKKFMIAFCCAAVFIGGPFMVKSIFYTGTPVYPIGAGMFKPVAAQPQEVWLEIRDKGNALVGAKDHYGTTKGLLDFLTHFWWIAVPEKGVNNRFDYPLGLPLLLVLVPFIYFLWDSLRKQNFPFLSILCVVYWLLWWFGIQQSRFLFVPLMLMITLVVTGLPRISKALRFCALLALGLTAMSVYRAQAADFCKRPVQVLRPYDVQLLEKARFVRRGEIVEVDTPDAAFAPFVVDVKKENGSFVFIKK